MKTLLLATLLLLPPAFILSHATDTIDTIDVSLPAPDSIIAITSSGSYVLTGSTTENRIVISPDVVATITLHNVSITSATASPFTLDSTNCTVALRIEGKDTLITTDIYSAGLEVNGNATLIIDGSGSLFAQGCGGAVNNVAVGGAGIGSGDHKLGGAIIINGGTITATSAIFGAGIGGGSSEYSYDHFGGSITINGGFVTAIGNYDASGIGSGYGNDPWENITINGGVVMAIGGNAAAGIGGCYGSSSAGNITITGGNVFAYAIPSPGYYPGAGIGTGDLGTNNAGSITITGGSIVTSRIGIGGIGGNLTPVSISGATTAIIANAINAAAIIDESAQVQTGVTLPLTVMQALAANAAYSALADTTLIWHEQHDTLELPDTLIHDTVINTDSLHDTLYMGTDSLHDTMYFDPDSVYDTLHVDVEVHDTITDTTFIYDTLYVADTVWSEAEVFDTTLIPVSVYDTTHVPVNVVDTTFIPDTLILRDTVVIWNDIPIPLYIVVDPILGTQTPVTDNAPIISAANGLLLTSLTPNAPFAVYSVDGSLILRTTATSSGTYRFATLSSGTYLLWHEGRWTKFVHE